MFVAVMRNSFESVQWTGCREPVEKEHAPLRRQKPEVQQPYQAIGAVAPTDRTKGSKWRRFGRVDVVAGTIERCRSSNNPPKTGGGSGIHAAADTTSTVVPTSAKSYTCADAAVDIRTQPPEPSGRPRTFSPWIGRPP